MRRRQEAPSTSEAPLRRLPVPARALVTTDETLGGRKPSAFAEKLVRLIPSKDSQRETVDKVVAALTAEGACAVKVMAKETSDIVAFAQAPADRMVLGTRELLEVMIEESSSPRKHQLSELVDELASKAGI